MASEGADDPALAERGERHQIEALLARYPELSLEEEAVILRFLKTARPEELGWIAWNDALRPKLQQFRSDHARDLSIGVRGLLTALAIVAAMVAAVVLLWEHGPAQ